MRLWAIRQKSTGYFLPMPEGRRGKGSSFTEPTPNCIPHLFVKEQYAKLSLGAWLKGKHKVTYNDHYDIFREDADYTETLEIIPVPGRSADDMEIVPLELMVIDGLSKASDYLSQEGKAP